MYKFYELRTHADFLSDLLKCVGVIVDYTIGAESKQLPSAMFTARGEASAVICTRQSRLLSKLIVYTILIYYERKPPYF